jgi:FKBP-type peptidyl-prolyl cis-trans isomerase SlyD
MQIAANTVVGFFYDLYDATSNELMESNQNEHPMAYLHGGGNILPALEEQLTGKAAGDTVEVTLEAANAYGERDETMIGRFAIKHLHPAEGSKLQEGEAAFIETEHGARQVVVLKLGKFQATIDANHPLAGKNLRFNVRIDSVRAATEEELSHGHAHGDGGHHH